MGLVSWTGHLHVIYPLNKKSASLESTQTCPGPSRSGSHSESGSGLLQTGQNVRKKRKDIRGDRKKREKEREREKREGKEGNW